MLQEMGGIEAYGSFRRFRFAGVFEPQALPSGGLKNGLQAAKGYKPSRDDQRLRLLLTIQGCYSFTSGAAKGQPPQQAPS
jgi:hypothetical protein